MRTPDEVTIRRAVMATISGISFEPLPGESGTRWIAECVIDGQKWAAYGMTAHDALTHLGRHVNLEGGAGG